MTAIPAVPPIDHALHLAKAAGIDKPAAPPSELAQKFDALMKRSTGAQESVHPSGHNAVGAMLETAQNKLSVAEAHLNDVMMAIPGMDPSEGAAASAMVAQEVAEANAQMTVASSLVSASKSSLESLLKNQ